MLEHAVEAPFRLVVIIGSVFLVLLFCLLCSASSCSCYDMVASEVIGMAVATIFQEFMLPYFLVLGSHY